VALIAADRESRQQSDPSDIKRAGIDRCLRDVVVAVIAEQFFGVVEGVGAGLTAILQRTF
jgi:hypothetical protein